MPVTKHPNSRFASATQTQSKKPPGASPERPVVQGSVTLPHFSSPSSPPEVAVPGRLQRSAIRCSTMTTIRTRIPTCACTHTSAAPRRSSRRRVHKSSNRGKTYWCACRTVVAPTCHPVRATPRHGCTSRDQAADCNGQSQSQVPACVDGLLWLRFSAASLPEVETLFCFSSLFLQTTEPAPGRCKPYCVTARPVHAIQKRVQCCSFAPRGSWPRLTIGGPSYKGTMGL